MTGDDCGSQGSPMSPILSNIVLNELDQESERRGHKYGRWADDFIIFVKSERAGTRVMESITRYLKGGLGLPVNKEKSKVAPIKDVGFLGFQILRGKLRVSNGAREKFKRKVRGLTKRNNPLSMRQIILGLMSIWPDGRNTFVSRSFGSSFVFWMNGFEADFARSS